MLVDLVAGARPNFMKIASIIKAIEARQFEGSQLKYRLVHTGQHYDARMSDDFFSQLEIPEPHVNLRVRSNTQAEQAAAIMVAYERLLLQRKSDLCLVVGDVTSTMACAIVARKLCLRVAHVEAGIRSGDQTMPEEINRVVTDSITNYFFTTSDVAKENLSREGVNVNRIYFVGNTMIDTLLANHSRFKKPEFFNRLNLKHGEYFVLTLHRPANVDDRTVFSKLLADISAGSRNLPVVFPVHPRTARTLREMVGIPLNIHVVDPQRYLEFNYLVENARAVITDSGGVTEEATVLGIPCMTLRNSTERPETVTMGTNELVGSDASALAHALNKLFLGQWKRGKIPPLWDGNAGTRIVAELEKLPW
jgi:UDP-N-acetylglucosamine 2-epimerase (non-hydrolysing)